MPEKAKKLRGFPGGTPQSEAAEAITSYLSARNGKPIVVKGLGDRETHGGDRRRSNELFPCRGRTTALAAAWIARRIVLLAQEHGSFVAWPYSLCYRFTGTWRKRCASSPGLLHARAGRPRFSPAGALQTGRSGCCGGIVGRSYCYAACRPDYKSTLDCAGSPGESLVKLWGRTDTLPDRAHGLSFPADGLACFPSSLSHGDGADVWRS